MRHTNADGKACKPEILTFATLTRIVSASESGYPVGFLVAIRQTLRLPNETQIAFASATFEGAGEGA